MAIKVTVSYDYYDCPHSDNGCSGGDIITIVAEENGREVEVTDGGCFGYSLEDLIAKLMNEWVADAH